MIIEPITFEKKSKKQEVVERTPEEFFKACTVGNIPLVKDFLSKSSSVTLLINENDETGLLLACKYGHYEIARILIRAKSDLNAYDSKNHSPIHYAILNGHHKILSLLIKHHADIDSYDVSGEFTPLMLAIKNRDYFAVHYLLDKVDLSVKNRKREDIFDFVLSETHISTNTKFIFSSHLRTRDEYRKRQQIYNILLSQSKEIARMTTRQMMEFLASNKLEKQDVYHFVFHKRHERMLHNIITKTSFVKDLRLVPTGYDNEYPFFLLSVKENLKIVVKAMIEKGVDVDHPLQEFDEKKILRLFSKEHIGKTPLMIAYMEGHVDMVDLLLEYNANVHARDKNNWTVMDMSKEKNDKTMLRKFRLYAD